MSTQTPATRAAGDITGLSAAELGEKIAARELSSVEVTQAHLDRIAEIDDQLGAFLHVSGSEALVAAKAADDAVAAELAIYRESFNLCIFALYFF